MLPEEPFVKCWVAPFYPVGLKKRVAVVFGPNAKLVMFMF
jgi:hypothetical protein